MKHKHYECIVAWAEGKEIQFRCEKHDWEDMLTSFPDWYTSYEYRIKPQPEISKEYYSESIKNEYYDEPPKKQYLYIYRGREGQTFVENYEKTMKDGFFTYMGKVEVIK
jgi:hypothetical protein